MLAALWCGGVAGASMCTTAFWLIHSNSLLVEQPLRMGLVRGIKFRNYY